MEAVMKEIKLVCDAPFFDKVDVNVLDFPSGREGEPRRRAGGYQKGAEQVIAGRQNPQGLF